MTVKESSQHLKRLDQVPLANLPTTQNSLQRLRVSAEILQKLSNESIKQIKLIESIEAKFNLLPNQLVKMLEEEWKQPTSLDRIMPIRLQQSLAILAHIHYLKQDLPEGLRQVDLVLEKSKREAEIKQQEAEKYRYQAQQKRTAKLQRQSRAWNGKRG